MKEIEVNSYNVPASARSKNYKGSSTSATGVNSTTAPTTATPTGGSADTAKVAQNLAADSTDWANIMRKDIDERTENSLSIGKNLSVDGTTTLKGLVSDTLNSAVATIADLTATTLKATSATIVGALTAATVSATTMTATTFIGDLQGNAATASKLKTARTIWGQNFDGSGNVSGRLSLDDSSVYWKEPYFGDQFAIVPSFPDADDANILCFQSAVGDFGTTPSLSTKMVITGKSGNVGIGTTTPAYKLEVSGNGHFTSNLYLDATVGTSNFVSHTTGWRADSNGNADFRNIYADELRVQAFTADISQALAGSDYLTKSVSKLSANFVVPSAGSSVRIIVDDIEGMPATQCFINGDYIRFRAFNRTSGLTIANVWGTVTLDTTFGTGGFLNGTQAYTFSCTSTSGAGLTVFKGSEVLDYGTSGSGMISRTTLDAQGSPYEQIATWINDPSNSANYTVHARLGNLNGIANCTGYGLYTDNGYFTGNIVIGDLTKSNNFLSFDGVNGLKMKLGGANVATSTDVSGAISTAALDATTKANNAYSNAVFYTNTQITATNNSITLAVNAIQVGGRNLLVNSKGPFKPSSESIDNYRLYPSSTAYLENGKTYTLSGKTNGVFSYVHDVNNQSDNCCIWMIGGGYNIIISDLTTGTTGTTLTWQYPTGTYVLRVNVYHPNSVNSIYAYDIQIEEGNKKTTYAPAPEDVNSSIASAQATAISQAASNAAALYVTSSAYNAEVTILQNAITSKVAQTDFNALGQTVGQHSTAIQQNAQAITSKVSSTDYTGASIASLINQSASTVAISAAHIDLQGAVTFSDFDSSTQQTINGKKDIIYNRVFSNGIGNGAFLIATFTINSIYIDRTIKLSVQDRGNNTPSNVYIKFANSSSNDPSIESFKKDGTIQFYMAKVATSTWNLYTNQNEGMWSDIAVTDFYNPQEGEISTTWRTDNVSLPAGYVTASQMIGTAEWCYNNNISYIDGGNIYAGTVNAVAITSGTITSDKVNMAEFTASTGFVDAFNANIVNTGRLDAATILTNALTSNTITATNATIANLTMTNASVSGYLHAEYSGGAFCRIGSASGSNIMSIRADGMTGVSIGVYGSNSTGISITANGISNYQAINSYGSCYFTTRQGEGIWMNGLSFGRVTITSGGDLGSGSLGWVHEGNTYVPNMIISKASSNISVYIPSDMPDGSVLMFRAAGDGTINIYSRNFSDKFQYGSQWNNWNRPYSPVAPGILNILVYDKSSNTWYAHGIS